MTNPYEQMRAEIMAEESKHGKVLIHKDELKVIRKNAVETFDWELDQALDRSKLDAHTKIKFAHLIEEAKTHAEKKLNLVM